MPASVLLAVVFSLSPFDVSFNASLVTSLHARREGGKSWMIGKEERKDR